MWALKGKEKKLEVKNGMTLARRHLLGLPTRKDILHAFVPEVDTGMGYLKARTKSFQLKFIMNFTSVIQPERTMPNFNDVHKGLERSFDFLYRCVLYHDYEDLKPVMLDEVWKKLPEFEKKYVDHRLTYKGVETYPLNNLSEHRDDEITQIFEVKYYLQFINPLGEYEWKKVIITYQTSMDKYAHNPFIFADIDFDDPEYEVEKKKQEKKQKAKDDQRVEYYDPNKKVDWKKWL